MPTVDVRTTPKEFGSKVYKMYQLGARLITISAIDLQNGKYDLVYHFSEGADVTNLRMEVDENEKIESMTGLYPNADLIESELLDFFGLKIEGAKPGRFLEPGSGICTPMRKERKPSDGGKGEEGEIDSTTKVEKTSAGSSNDNSKRVDNAVKKRGEK